jgi:hypothetical protein
VEEEGERVTESVCHVCDGSLLRCLWGRGEVGVSLYKNDSFSVKNTRKILIKVIN